MTRQKKGVIAVLIFIAGIIFLPLFFGEKKVITSVLDNRKSQVGSQVDKAVSPVPVTALAATPDSRLQKASPEPREPVWKKNLEKTLFAQAGGTLKRVEIKVVDSFPWKVGAVELLVDSILVRLEGSKGQRSSFRAIVDATNGKILQTWDRPIIDHLDSKSDNGIRIDPRYHSN